MSNPIESGYRVALIIAETDRGEILTVPRSAGGSEAAAASGGWTLPSVTMAPGARIRDWTSVFETLTGSPVAILRIETVASLDDHPSLLVVELDAATTAVADGVWHPIASLDLDRVEPILRDVIEQWRARYIGGIWSAQMPWSEPGWFDQASEWMIDSLEQIGWLPTANPVQHYLWSITSVLRCPTTGGDAYLKATSPLFPRESAMTALLETHAHGLTPSVLAVEPDHGWLLMADHGGRPLDEQPESTWAAGMAAHARIQAGWAPHLDEARAIGIPERSLEDLANAATEIAEDDVRMERLDDQTRVRFRQAVPRLVDHCGRLDAIGIADTLIHGDLHPGNVALTDDGCVVFDWSDVAIGMPYIDLVPYVFHGTDLVARRQCRDVYLAARTDGVDPRLTRLAADLALPLGCLYQVVSYIDIQRGLGDDIGDMADADLYWIGRTVRALDDGIDARTS